jgi:hypothetical protein
MSRKLISLPSIEDLKREAERNGTHRRLHTSEEAYRRAQWQIQQAQEQMAWAALAIVRPDEFERIDGPRRIAVREANMKAKREAREFFTDECLGFASER